MATVSASPLSRVEVPMIDMRVALAAASPAIETHLAEMHARGHYILGPQVETFEREFAAALGAAEAVGVGTGTAALELCLRAAGIGPGAEVIVPSMTSLFTAQAVLQCGARLRIADVHPDDLLLTAETIEQAGTPATRAVIAVHLYGQPCQLAEIADLCQRRNWSLIQDACQAHGSFFEGKPLTHYSPYCAYSFYPTKNLGALGDGGAVVTSDPEVARRIRLLRDGGRLGTQVCQAAALNSRLDAMQACYLRAFLPLLAEWNAHRRHIAQTYQRQLPSDGPARLLHFTADSVHHLVVARSRRRDALREHLAQLGIQTGIHYPVPLHEQPGFLPYASWREQPKVASAAAREILSLPVGPHVTDAMAVYVLEGIASFPI